MQARLTAFIPFDTLISKFNSTIAKKYEEICNNSDLRLATPKAHQELYAELYDLGKKLESKEEHALPAEEKAKILTSRLFNAKDQIESAQPKSAIWNKIQKPCELIALIDEVLDTKQHQYNEIAKLEANYAYVQYMSRGISLNM